MYQLFRSLAYIHSLGICHRDIKPQNLLLDPETGVLKLCDFGSAKLLVKGEPNVSYICSRYYRAPELIFGAIDYTTKIGKSISSEFCKLTGIDFFMFQRFKLARVHILTVIYCYFSLQNTKFFFVLLVLLQASQTNNYVTLIMI